MRDLVKSRHAFEKAKTVITGGVNSPVRAFKAVGGTPVFIQSGKGATIFDIDGNTYIDYVASWGPLILGNADPDVICAVTKAMEKGLSFGAATEQETELAEMIISFMPSIELVRLVNSGTEATMSAIRLARAYTKRDMIVKFDGAYHGHSDSFLIAAGSGAATCGVPDSPGVTVSTASNTLLANFNDIDSVNNLFASHKDRIAAVIMEPVMGNMGVILPQKGFLESVRQITETNGALLIFDEVMSGFRVARGGVQKIYGIKPDLTTLGKIIGGGLAVGAFGGRKDIMQMIAPDGPVYQAGTLSGNPLAVAAGLATLKIIKEDCDFYDRLEEKTSRLAKGLCDLCKEKNVPAVVNRIGSMLTLFFTSKVTVNNAHDARSVDKKFYAGYFHQMLKRGIYLPPSPFEAFFVSSVHTEDHINQTINAASEAISAIKS